MPLTGLSAGHHQLVIEGKPKAGGDAVQQTLDLMLRIRPPAVTTSSPSGRAQVLHRRYQGAAAQERQGLPVQALPLSRLVQPVVGQCRQYEPGVGTNGRMPGSGELIRMHSMTPSTKRGATGSRFL